MVEPYAPTIIILEGDQTGQELLLEALRVLHPDVIRLPLEFEHFDLSLENRRATSNLVIHEAAEAIRRTGLGLKAATITPAPTVARTKEGAGVTPAPPVVRTTARARDAISLTPTPAG